MSGYQVESESGCSVALCSSRQYIPMILDPALHVSRPRGQETVKVVEDLRLGLITEKESARLGISKLMRKAFLMVDDEFFLYTAIKRAY